jgi:N-acetylglutamate synthase-like GNAT family acetyltransferase
MANVLIRLASEADLPAVLEMSKGVYGDNDYFLSEFLNFLNDPSRRILVAEKDGKVVGLQVVHIVDEGETSSLVPGSLSLFAALIYLNKS